MVVFYPTGVYFLDPTSDRTIIIKTKTSIFQDSDLCNYQILVRAYASWKSFGATLGHKYRLKRSRIKVTLSVFRIYPRFRSFHRRFEGSPAVFRVDAVCFAGLAVVTAHSDLNFPKIPNRLSN